jgi:hypothetical protein
MKPTTTQNVSILRSTITYLNSNGVTGHVGTPKERRGSYNCWGFTRGILETQEHFRWEDIESMEEWLSENTDEINMHKEPLKCGDIVVFRGVNEGLCCCNMYDEEGEDFEVCTCEPELLHTAVLVDPAQEIIIHKPGGRPLERCTIQAVLDEGAYGGVTEYRRYNKCGKAF